MMFTRREFTGSAALLAGAAFAPRALAAATDEDARLAEFFEAVFQRNLDRSPIRQSRLGIRKDQDKWDEIGEARAQENLALGRQDLAAVRRFDRAKLSPQSALSHRMFERDLIESIEHFRWRHHGYEMTQMGGLHTRVPITLMNSHPITSLDDATDYILRVERVAPLFEALIAETERQEAMGIRPPRFVYPLVIGPSENMLKGRPFAAGEDSPILADFRKKLAGSNIPEAERPALIARLEAALTTRFGPAYRSLIAHLKRAEAQADDRDGAWKLPDGAAFYRAQLEGYTTLPLTAEAIHTTGLREVARIHDEMRAIAKKVGFGGSLQDFFQHMRTDPRFYHEDSAAGRAAYVAEADQLLAEIKARQDELFGIQPKSDVIVKPVEAWREKSAAKAFYQNPPQDGSQPGVFYVNLADMKAQPRYQLAAILYHEAVPGHHVETAVAHELEGLPKFRRFGGIAAYSEGWGLYSERLPKEMGLYRDPYSDFGRLTMALMRACRLVVDTGIHAMKWSREQATAYFDANMPSSHYDNQREIDRYVVLPGQATSYYIGMLKIVELRARARERLGSGFDLRGFHDVVLGNGPLPLPILEEVVDGWIARGGKGAAL